MGTLFKLLGLLGKLEPYFPTIIQAFQALASVLQSLLTKPTPTAPISSAKPLPSSGIPIVEKRPPTEIAKEVQGELKKLIEDNQNAKYTPPKGKEPGQKHVSLIDEEVTVDEPKED